MTGVATDSFSAMIMDTFREDQPVDYLKLTVDATDASSFSVPVYYATGSNSQIYNVTLDTARCDSFGYRPSEFDHVRIPPKAEPMGGSDKEMIVYNVSGNKVFEMAQVTADRDEQGNATAFYACYFAVYYVNSNGLHYLVEQYGADPLKYCDDAEGLYRCQGHRGFAPPIFAVEWDQVNDPPIEHAIKISADNTCEFIWPAFSGEAGCPLTDGGNPNYEGATGLKIKEGLRLRIKSSFNCQSVVNVAARAICRALQKYGAFVGDRSGFTATLKLEGCALEGLVGYKTCNWVDLLGSDYTNALSQLTWDKWEVALACFPLASCPAGQTPDPRP